MEPVLINSSVSARVKTFLGLSRGDTSNTNEIGERMMRLNRFSLDDRAFMHLVAIGEKPCTNVTLTPFDFDRNRAHASLEPNMDDVLHTSRELKKLGLPHSMCWGRGWLRRRGELAPYLLLDFDIGKDDESLAKLLRSRTEIETGIAYGFPLDAILNYKMRIGRRELPGDQHMKSLVKALREGKTLEELPKFATLHDHIPAEFDYPKGYVSPSSEMRAQRQLDMIGRDSPRMFKALVAEAKAYLETLRASGLKT